MKHEKFLEQLALGKRTEQMVAFIPKLSKYLLIPNTDINNQTLAKGGAPRAFRRNVDGYCPQADAIVLPDFEVIGGGRRFGLEVKGKANFTTLRTGIYIVGDQQTFNGECNTRWQGIDLSAYFQYCEWQRQTGTELILMFCEASTGEVLARSLTALGRPRAWVPGLSDEVNPDYGRGRCGVVGMAYFSREKFLVFHQGSPDDVPLFREHPELLAPTLPQASDNLAEI